MRRPEHRLVQSYLRDLHAVQRKLDEAEALDDESGRDRAVKCVEEALDQIVIGMIVAGFLDAGIEASDDREIG